MTHEPGALQRLGVSDTQLADYFSKEYVATLVSSTHSPRAARSSQRRLKSALWY
jgi:hypothetical protein